MRSYVKLKKGTFTRSRSGNIRTNEGLYIGQDDIRLIIRGSGPEGEFMTVFVKSASITRTLAMFIAEQIEEGVV